jgi:hypothetical protein
MRNTSKSIPGIAVGTQEAFTITPALPEDAPAQGASRSINTTS